MGIALNLCLCAGEVIALAAGEPCRTFNNNCLRRSHRDKIIIKGSPICHEGGQGNGVFNTKEDNMKLLKNKKNKMTLKKGLLVAGLAGASIALLGQPALAAKGDRQYHEEEWKKTKTYGNTPIAEDSANEWGPWKAFIQPAAGPLAIAPMPGMRTDGARYYRPESVDEFSPKYSLAGGGGAVEISACQSGDWCGYMAYSSYSYNENYDEGDGAESGPFPGIIGLRLMPDDAGAYDVDGKVSYRVSNLYNPGVLVHQSGENGDMPVEFWYLPNFYGESYEYEEVNSGHWIEGSYPPAGDEDGQSTAGGVWQWTRSQGGEGVDYWYSESGFGGTFVAGITTSLADMANFGGVTEANYYGNTGYGGTPVEITVNFNQATWSGSWNNGVDGHMHNYTDSNGTPYMTGDVGFNAEGTIAGANIQSTSIWAGDGTIDQSKSTVVGSFLGTAAEVLGGVSDITKSKPAGDDPYADPGYTDIRNVDTFVTCAGSECSSTDR